MPHLGVLCMKVIWTLVVVTVGGGGEGGGENWVKMNRIQ